MRYLGVSEIQRIVATIGVEATLQRMADYVEADFRRWPEFEKSARLASHSPDGVVELMPICDSDHFSFKYVNGHPDNTKAGLQTVVAFGVLADMATGYPILLSEMTILTALRTAATSALAARHLARPDARSMAIIGLGAQSEFQALAFRALLGITSLKIYDIDPSATKKFISNMAGRGFTITPADDAGSAVLGVDVITTVTADKAHATILSDNMIGAGVHLNAVGGDCPGKTELQPGILLRANVFVELTAQTRIEGEIQQMPDDFAVTELWEVISGKSAGRCGRDEITIFDSVGFAIEDYSALRLFHDLALETGVVGEIDLLTSPDDPRDLFGLAVDLEVAASQPSPA